MVSDDAPVPAETTGRLGGSDQSGYGVTSSGQTRATRNDDTVYGAGRPEAAHFDPGTPRDACVERGTLRCCGNARGNSPVLAERCARGNLDREVRRISARPA